ncbi:MAG TPA: hypothetical protein VN641_10010 [Urbifossiella sp.]|nr:hypothetical protein [Urbifossiella sp.]
MARKVKFKAAGKLDAWRRENAHRFGGSGGGRSSGNKRRGGRAKGGIPGGS